MFKDQKSNGFHVEKTRVTDSKRIETLLIFTTLAHIFYTTEGYRQEIQGDTKKRRHGELIRPRGLFLVGLKAFNQAIRKAGQRFFKQFIHCLSIFMAQPLKL